MNLLKYEYYCETESKNICEWRNDTESAPTLCKTDHAHTITADSLAIIETKPDVTNTDSAGYQLVSQTFGDVQGLQVVFQGHKYTATAGVQNFFDELVTTQIKLREGRYTVFNSAAVDDYVEFSVIDKDDVLGLFTGLGLVRDTDILELAKSVRKKYINPSYKGETPLGAVNAVKTIISGLYYRTIYNSTGVSDVNFSVTYEFYEA